MVDNNDRDIKISYSIINQLFREVRESISSIDVTLNELTVSNEKLIGIQKDQISKLDLVENVNEINAELIKLKDVLKHLDTKFDVLKENVRTNSDVKDKLMDSIHKTLQNFDNKLFRFLTVTGIVFVIFLFIMGLLQSGLIKLG